jgi:hypothetical protein
MFLIDMEVFDKFVKLLGIIGHLELNRSLFRK